MNALSIRSKLVMLFSALVTLPLLAASAWLGITAHRSVLDAGRELTQVADQGLRQSAQDVARLTAENADRSTAELVKSGSRSLTGFAKSETRESERTLQLSAEHLTHVGSAVMQHATEQIATTSGAAVNQANARLRHHQRQAVSEVSQALIRSSRRAFEGISRDMTAESEAMVVKLASDLNLERSKRTATLVQTFVQNGMDGVTRLAQDPKLLSAGPSVTPLLRQLLEDHRFALVRAALRADSGQWIAEWPPPLASVPGEPAPLPQVAAAALASNRVEQSPAQFGPPGKPPEMEIAAAVRGGSGRSPGSSPRRVLIATLSLEMLSHLLGQQLVGDERSAPVFVMTPEGQVLAHSEPGQVGIRLSLAPPKRVVRVDANTMMIESPGSGAQRRLTHLTDIAGTRGWKVVAVQPLADLLDKTEALRRNIHQTAEAAAGEMEREAQLQAARLEAAAIQEQGQVADQTAQKIRAENRQVVDQAVAALVQQQKETARRDLDRVRHDSQQAAHDAAVAMAGTAKGIASRSGVRIRSEADLRAHLRLASMHELARGTAAAAAGRVAFESSGILLVALLGALLVALLTAQSAVRPITALAAGARSIAAGDFSHRVPITGEDELGQLAASFNRMATSIEASRQELEASNITLAQEKRRIQAIVDNSPDGLLILDTDGRIGYLNPAAREMLPWRGPIPGNGAVPLEASLPDDFLRSLHDCLDRIDSGQTSVGDLTLESPRRILQVRTVVLVSGPTAPGSPPALGRLVHLHDVTREREIDEMKSSFVMLVSHELRTPLTSILGFSSYMLMGKMGPLTEAQHAGLESIERQARRLKAIAADFLDLSRIETGSLEIRRDPVDLERVARRVMEELSPQARERGLWLRLATIRRGSAVAQGDEGRIAQIFTNLIHNGIKFTEHGGVEVAILPGPDLIRVEIRDTGIGIPAEEQARIFDRFYQVEGVVTRRAGGTGLGLSIVKILVQAHGGEVGISNSSAPDSPAASRQTPERPSEGGTTFYFTLPAAKAADTRRPLAVAARAGDGSRDRLTSTTDD